MLIDDLEEFKEHLAQLLDTMTADAKRLEQMASVLKSSHRCWPSRVGLGIAAFLAVYILFMHSNFFSELNTATVSQTHLTAKIAALQTRVELLETPPIVKKPFVKKPWWR